MPRERGSLSKRIVVAAAGLALARAVLHLLLRSACGGFTFLMSPTEVERTRAALAFAAHPAFAPLGIVYWLPLQFWLEGGLFRFWPDALAVPFAVNTAASALTAAGVVLWTAELAGEAAALAAGVAFFFSATSLIIGVGGSADPLLNAAVVWALFFWARFENSGRSSQAWLCAVCLTLGAAARFEAWVVAGALTAAAVLDRRRTALWPLAAAWLFPAAWCAYCAAEAGSPWAFASQTLAAEIRDLSRSTWSLSLSFLSDFLEVVPPWLAALALGNAFSDRRRLPRSYWFSLGAIALFYVGLHPFAMMQVDDHLWVVYLLALPAAGACVASALAGVAAPRRRAAAAAAAFALLLAAESAHLSIYARYFKRFEPLTSVYMSVRSLRRAGAFSGDDAVLVELPDGRRVGVRQYGLWTLEPSMRGLFDRELRYAPEGGRIDPSGNPSALGLPRPELAAWLKARRVRAVVAFQHDAALAGLGWKRAGGPPEAGVWLAPGDPLADRPLP
ncbi:MAG: hypothetical protein ACHQ2Z_00720 [Elusimicrobiota bacterium]